MTCRSIVIEPSVLYFGTPVALVSTLNPDGTTNLSPMSSAWSLGDRLVLGFGRQGRAYENLVRHADSVVNLPSAALVAHVERLAPTTSVDPAPESKPALGYRHEADEFRRAELTAVPSERVALHLIAKDPAAGLALADAPEAADGQLVGQSRHTRTSGAVTGLLPSPALMEPTRTATPTHDTPAARMPNPGHLIPDAMQAILALKAATETGGVPPETLELVHLRASQINGCASCVDAGARSARRAGVSEPRLAAVAAWRGSPHFDPAERAALALTEAATRLSDRPDAVPDAVWAEAARHYDEQALAALVLAVATTNLFNRINVATAQVAGA